jgi:diketogulonate reductase-like aldo/keto reductase
MDMDIMDDPNMSNISNLRSETWRAMEDSLLQGKCRAIGVSNFTIRHLETLSQTARIWPPAVNQIELHPYNQQRELIKYYRDHGIIVQAYASLGGQDSGKKTFNALGGKLLERNEVKAIAKKHGKTEAQILLRWAIENGFSCIPKSTSRKHMEQNLESAIDTSWKNGGFDAHDVQVLNNLNVEDEISRLCWVRDPLKMLDFD